LRVLEKLLSSVKGELNALVNSEDNFELTPLMIAAYCGYEDAVKLLLENGNEHSLPINNPERRQHSLD
jgi:ankyrin repeat protein